MKNIVVYVYIYYNLLFKLNTFIIIFSYHLFCTCMHDTSYMFESFYFLQGGTGKLQLQSQ